MSGEIPTDPTAYYPDFWNYASLYGEAAARAYYTTWSPPVGTPPPEGMVIPTPSEAPATAVDSSAGDQTQANQSPEVNFSLFRINYPMLRPY